jgi:hypothetical protein
MPSKWYEQTDKRGYPSKYSPGKFVTGAQYLIELLCERKAALEGKTLPIKFWNIDEWEKEFKAQTRSVNALLKKYDLRALIHVLHANPRIYSLRAKWVLPKIEYAQKLVNADKARFAKVLAASKQTSVNRSTIDSKPRKRIIKKNPLSQLFELDEQYGEEEDEACRGTSASISAGDS